MALVALGGRAAWTTVVDPEPSGRVLGRAVVVAPGHAPAGAAEGRPAGRSVGSTSSPGDEGGDRGPTGGRTATSTTTGSGAAGAGGARGPRSAAGAGPASAPTARPVTVQAPLTTLPAWLAPLPAGPTNPPLAAAPVAPYPGAPGYGTTTEDEQPSGTSDRTSATGAADAPKD